MACETGRAGEKKGNIDGEVDQKGRLRRLRGRGTYVRRRGGDEEGEAGKVDRIRMQENRDDMIKD